MTTPELYNIYLQNPSIQTDTRKLKQGDIFFALKGPNFNGNLFAAKALEAGAAYAVIDEVQDTKNERMILVPDTLQALQDLASYHRDQFKIPFIAITGSNGKTTTKELVSAVLAAHFKTYTTQGNLNNHIGVPLTILSIHKDAEMAVIEMGANHQKEIAGYCVYTKPTHGIITNCGKAHLEGFGGIEGVRKGKGELFDYIKAHNGAIFMYDDYDYLHTMSNGITQKQIYGTQNGTVTGQVKNSEPFLEVSITKGLEKKVISTQLVGDYNLPNVLCAIAIGKHFGVPEEKITTTIEQYTPSNSRSQMLEQGSNHIILDAYNANPTSMRAAIENFAKFPSTEKVLMLGGMMELGKESIQEHQQIVELIHQHAWKQVVLVGGDFAQVQHPYIYFPDATTAGKWYQEQAFQNTYFLIKGSRSMQMEKIIV
ncbi:UDP-N-acetylmuramoyl-tripeptide--D-alanyl-D-alanine ligase [Sediminibacterium sp. KACHI17]|uniref:UDP-N-acetylmuramoyl-tripeptide--D-alanyl-D-alanine ligase n=1 Tax=Sediminibacterium sp. KACHI17 TaxID=1751071 RepID=A0AAT9GIB4_9BACT